MTPYYCIKYIGTILGYMSHVAVLVERGGVGESRYDSCGVAMMSFGVYDVVLVE